MFFKRQHRNMVGGKRVEMYNTKDEFSFYCSDYTIYLSCLASHCISF